MLLGFVLKEIFKCLTTIFFRVKKNIYVLNDDFLFFCVKKGIQYETYQYF